MNFKITNEQSLYRDPKWHIIQNSDTSRQISILDGHCTLTFHLINVDLDLSYHIVILTLIFDLINVNLEA